MMTENTTKQFRVRMLRPFIVDETFPDEIYNKMIEAFGLGNIDTHEAMAWWVFLGHDRNELQVAFNLLNLNDR
jgi:hypothetical protein